jgi:hypothetical protein
VVADGKLAARQPHLDRSFRRAELGRVVQQVLERHAQPVSVTLDDAPREECAELRLRPVAPRRVQGFGGDRVELDGGHVSGWRLAPGQVGDAGHQPAELRDLVGDPGEYLLALHPWQVRVLGENVDVEAQARERGTELVAGVADQAPLRLK